MLFRSIFLENGLIQLRFHGKPSQRKLVTRLCWPWNFSDDFNDLGKSVRNNLILKGGKEEARKVITKSHPHQYQKLDCDKRCETNRPRVPLEAYDLRARLDDTIFTSRAKNNLRNDVEISGERCRSVASSLMLELVLANFGEIQKFQELTTLRQILEGEDHSPKDILREINSRARLINMKKCTDE